MKVYRIVNWGKHFENNRTRILKTLDWVPIPNKHDGDGYTELMDHKDGMAHYGAWCLIVGVASKCHPRGTLLREGARPHDSASLARVTRGQEKVFESALPRLVAVGWLEVAEIENQHKPLSVNDMALSGTSMPDGDVHPAPYCAKVTIEGKGIEGNRTEGNKGIEGDATRALSLLALHYLNERAGRAFRETDEYLKLIEARILEVDGDIEGVKQMIDRQVSLWGGDPKMEEYLRPQTLFAKSKFQSYYDDRSRPVIALRVPDHRAEKAAREYQQDIQPTML